MFYAFSNEKKRAFKVRFSCCVRKCIGNLCSSASSQFASEVHAHVFSITLIDIAPEHVDQIFLHKFEFVGADIVFKVQHVVVGCCQCSVVLPISGNENALAIVVAAQLALYFLHLSVVLDHLDELVPVLFVLAVDNLLGYFLDLLGQLVVSTLVAIVVVEGVAEAPDVPLWSKLQVEFPVEEGSPA
jgi:hypothetical protein